MKLDVMDLSGCDQEPIHIPGSIQPHGVMLVAGRDSLAVSHVAGAVEARLGQEEWQDRSLGELIGDQAASRIARITDSPGAGGFVSQWASPGGEVFDISARPVGDHVVVELEPALGQSAAAATVLGGLEAAVAAFERCPDLKSLCARAAVEFRRLTGFDRVMIYRFLGDEAGTVVAEDRDPVLPSFLNHHFPGSDIPRQARALYVRNLVRAIPDVSYTPAPLRPAWTREAPLDMSDFVLRSVSPIHMQYMRNMGVGASASVSIVKDGALWGLVACHHASPRLLPFDQRAACRALAGALSRQIKAREEAEGYRERIRLRTFEDEFAARLAAPISIDEAMHESLGQLQRMVAADGVAVLRAGDLSRAGVCPPESAIRELAGWLVTQGAEPLATDRLADHHAAAEDYAAAGSGLLAVIISADEPFLILWFRAEAVEVVNWAGNPHKDAELAPGEILTPRASFDAWAETVRGRARPWTLAETEGAARVRQLLLASRQARRLKELNQRLAETLADKDSLLQQKELLLREVNHRVQNSLQLVSSFLGLQARAEGNEALNASFDEARRRLNAVALVHRRLYHADQIESVDLARYLDDLCAEMLAAMGPEWAGQLRPDIAPVTIPTDRAVTLGLILTELVINANKYAYDGAPGPIDIILQPHGSDFRLVVADHGRGKHEPRQGFGTRMMTAMVNQLSGILEYEDNRPGLRAVLTAPIVGPRVA